MIAESGRNFLIFLKLLFSFFFLKLFIYISALLLSCPENNCLLLMVLDSRKLLIAMLPFRAQKLHVQYMSNKNKEGANVI